MKKLASGAEEIVFAGARALIKQRGDGLWVVRWREMGKGRNTTKVDVEKARQFAREKVRELARGQGGRLLSIEDAQLVERVKRLAGDRAPMVWLSEIEEAQALLRAGGTLRQAAQYFAASGMLTVQRVPFRVARIKYLASYLGRSTETVATRRKILDRFERQEGRAEGAVCELTEEVLRAELGGTKVAAKTFNNRLNTWKTFLNFCRASLKAWPAGEKHPAELIPRRAEMEGIPAIFTPEEARAALGVLPAYLLPSFILGCWMGLRPRAELRKVLWEHLDWERGYLHIPKEVAGKTGRERYVPIPENVRALLAPLRREAGKLSGRMHIEEISAKLREKGVIKQWVPDVMRHSYISYQIALGHGIGQVAEWAGTSEKKIRKNYRRPLRREDGEAWFVVGREVEARSEE